MHLRFPPLFLPCLGQMLPNLRHPGTMKCSYVMVGRLILFLGCLFQLQAQNPNPARPQDIDPTFQFATNYTTTLVINDLLLLPNGGIAVVGGNDVAFQVLTARGVRTYPDPESRWVGNPSFSVVLNSEGMIL